MENVDFESYYGRFVKKNQVLLWFGTGLSVLLGATAIVTDTWILAVIGVFAFLTGILLQQSYNAPYKEKLNALQRVFPTQWKEYLTSHSTFYAELTEIDKAIFDKRVLLFLSSKRIIGIETEVEEGIQLLVAASAIIPTFAFPYFEYPNVKEVLIYPNAFDENFQTEFNSKERGTILGMVGNGVLNNSVLFSKPHLIAGFNGKYDKQNVGIHEFVHLLDKADGAIDGVPQIFLSNTYTLPWMKALKEEMQRIKQGSSDINAYGLTNNAEFLSVASEYFFDNPVKFHKRHPELYQLLCGIYHQKPDNKSWFSSD